MKFKCLQPPAIAKYAEVMKSKKNWSTTFAGKKTPKVFVIICSIFQPGELARGRGGAWCMTLPVRRKVVSSD
jgi:arginine deiminase